MQWKDGPSAVRARFSTRLTAAIIGLANAATRRIHSSACSSLTGIMVGPSALAERSSRISETTPRQSNRFSRKGAKLLHRFFCDFASLREQESQSYATHYSLSADR